MSVICCRRSRPRVYTFRQELRACTALSNHGQTNDLTRLHNDPIRFGCHQMSGALVSLGPELPVDFIPLSTPTPAPQCSADSFECLPVAILPKKIARNCPASNLSAPAPRVCQHCRAASVSLLGRPTCAIAPSGAVSAKFCCKRRARGSAWRRKLRTGLAVSKEGSSASTRTLATWCTGTTAGDTVRRTRPAAEVSRPRTEFRPVPSFLHPTARRPRGSGHRERGPTGLSL